MNVKPVDLEILRRNVSWLVENGDGDPEASHGHEDRMMKNAIRQYAPPEIVAEFERLWDAPFRRWYA